MLIVKEMKERVELMMKRNARRNVTMTPLVGVQREFVVIFLRNKT